jgi:hypothetical protein|tara:strand:+ start:1408 stop:1575 length:168 start_codon:yes stop_codon:yes gene_type:complete
MKLTDVTPKDKLKTQAKAELKAMNIGSEQLLAEWIVKYTGPIIHEVAQELEEYQQ